MTDYDCYPKNTKRLDRGGGGGRSWSGWGCVVGGVSVRVTVPLRDECFFPEVPLSWDLALGEQLTPFDCPRRGQASASYRHCLWTAPTLDKPTLAW